MRLVSRAHNSSRWARHRPSCVRPLIPERVSSGKSKSWKITRRRCWPSRSAPAPPSSGTKSKPPPLRTGRPPAHPSSKSFGTRSSGDCHPLPYPSMRARAGWRRPRRTNLPPPPARKAGLATTWCSTLIPTSSPGAFCSCPKSSSRANAAPWWCVSTDSKVCRWMSSGRTRRAIHSITTRDSRHGWRSAALSCLCRITPTAADTRSASYSARRTRSNYPSSPSSPRSTAGYWSGWARSRSLMPNASASTGCLMAARPRCGCRRCCRATPFPFARGISTIGFARTYRWIIPGAICSAANTKCRNGTWGQPSTMPKWWP